MSGRLASQRAARASRKGGLPNAVSVVADAARMLGRLRGQVSEVRITLPWGALLRSVLRGERAFALAAARHSLPPTGVVAGRRQDE